MTQSQTSRQTIIDSWTNYNFIWFSQQGSEFGGRRPPDGAVPLFFYPSLVFPFPLRGEVGRRYFDWFPVDAKSEIRNIQFWWLNSSYGQDVGLVNLEFRREILPTHALCFSPVALQSTLPHISPPPAA